MKPIFYLLLIFPLLVLGQDNIPFAQEVQALKAKYDTIWDSNQETIVFTGSSSIRMWKNLKDLFPRQQIVNTGFGGSQATDLLHHRQELILRFNPKKVFIYEGDNDIVSGKKIKNIVATTQQIISHIKRENPNTQLILIAAKPSISRWHYKRKYKRLNRRLQKLAHKETGVQYADVWTAMLDGRQLKQDIFIEDGLHLNEKGYNLWYSVIAPFMKDDRNFITK